MKRGFTGSLIPFDTLFFSKNCLIELKVVKLTNQNPKKRSKRL